MMKLALLTPSCMSSLWEIHAARLSLGAHVPPQGLWGFLIRTWHKGPLSKHDKSQANHVLGVVSHTCTHSSSSNLAQRAVQQKILQQRLIHLASLGHKAPLCWAQMAIKLMHLHGLAQRASKQNLQCKLLQQRLTQLASLGHKEPLCWA